MSKELYLKHKIFLIAVFLLGNTVIVFPKGIGVETAIYSLAFSVIPTIILMAVFYKISKFEFLPNTVLKVMIFLLCIIVFIISANDYITFVDAVRLPKTPRFIISTLFVLLSFLLGLMKRRVLYLFSLYAFFIVLGILVLVFVASFNKLTFTDLTIKDFNFKDIVRQSLTFFIHSFGELTIPFLLLLKLKNKENNRILNLGVLFGFLIILTYVLNIMLVLGSATAKVVEYPYSTLTSLVSFGRNFSRLDGFTYYVYFFSTLIKCAITINLAVEYVKIKTAVFFTAAILLIICNLNFLDVVLKSDIFNLCLLIFEILLPITILIFVKFKVHRK